LQPDELNMPCRISTSPQAVATVFAASLAFAAIDAWFPIEEGAGELAIIALLLPIGLILSRRHDWFPRKGKPAKDISPPPSPRLRKNTKDEFQDGLKPPGKYSKKEIPAQRLDQKIEKCIKEGDLDGAEVELAKLAARAVAADFHALIQASAKAKDPSRAEYWVGKMEEAEICPNQFCYGSLIYAYAQTSQVDKAEECLNRMQSAGIQANTVCYNSVLSACARMGEHSRAETCFARMKDEGVEADAITYNTLIDACAREGNVEKAEAWLAQLLESGLEANVVSFGSVMHACACAGQHNRAEEWLTKAREAGVAPNAICFNTIIHSVESGGFRQG
jgi:pentatricopeptide repeat protein